MLVEKNCSLQPFNSFGIAARAQTLVHVRSVDDILQLLEHKELGRGPFLCWAAAATSCSRGM